MAVRQMTHRLSYAIIIIFGLLLSGTVFYAGFEGWSYVDSFYFSVMTLTTIGYGDLAPTTDIAKMFTSFYALFGIGAMLYIIISVIGGFILRQERIFSRVFFPMKKINRQEKVRDQQGREISERKERSTSSRRR